MNKLWRVSIPDTARCDASFNRTQRRMELALLVLAFSVVPPRVSPILGDRSASERVAVFAFDTLARALFVVDPVAKVAVCADRWGRIRSRWLDVLIAVLFLGIRLRPRQPTSKTLSWPSDGSRFTLDSATVLHMDTVRSWDSEPASISESRCKVPCGGLSVAACRSGSFVV